MHFLNALLTKGLHFVEREGRRLPCNSTGGQISGFYSNIFQCYISSLRFYIYTQKKEVYSVFMFSHKINNTGYIIVKLYT